MAAALAAVIAMVKQTRLDHNCNNIIMEMEGYIIDMASVTIEYYYTTIIITSI